MLAQHAVQATASSVVSQVIISTASAASTALLFWILRTVRKFMAEHDWLIETTKSNTEAIAKNTEAIKRMLDQEDRRTQRRRP